MPGTRRKTAATMLLERLEQDETLGRIAEDMADKPGKIFGSGPLGDALRGRSLGHALHPLLVQVPIGALLSAAALDLVQGRKAGKQSRLLMGLATLSVLPAVTSGWAEWSRADDRTKRVGIAHAGVNGVAAVLATASYLLRLKGWSPAAAVLTGLAGAAVGAGGFLGGHLSLVRKYASHDEPSDTEGMTHGQYE